MRVMVSLNLADIMTATRRTTPQQVQEPSNNEADATDLAQESQIPTQSETNHTE